MNNSIRRALLRGVGFAAASGALLATPSFAGTEPGAEQLKLEPATAEQAKPQPQQEVAQTFGAPAVEVIEVESVNGWYLTIGAGAAWPSDMNVRTRNFDPNENGDLSFGGGFSGDAGLGYDFGALRAELTYGYTRASVDEISASGFDINSSGIINKNDVMASLYWDILPGRWTPYLGGGVGYTNLSTPSVNFGNGLRSSSENQGLFGWQGKVGVSYAMSTNWDVYVEGTYSGAEGFSSDNVRFDSYNDFGAKLGFRYRFAQPEAVVVVEPAPAPQPQPEPAPMPMPEPEPAPAPIRGLW
jgi:opacity protein-like surface antigen